MILKSLSETGQSSNEPKTQFVQGKNWTKSTKYFNENVFSCSSFVVKPFFFPLSKDTCDGLFRVWFPVWIHFFNTKIVTILFWFWMFRRQLQICLIVRIDLKTCLSVCAMAKKTDFVIPLTCFLICSSKMYTRVLTGQCWLIMPSWFIHLQACSFRAEAVQPWQIHKIWNYTTSISQL